MRCFGLEVTTSVEIKVFTSKLNRGLFVFAMVHKTSNKVEKEFLLDMFEEIYPAIALSHLVRFGLELLAFK